METDELASRLQSFLRLRGLVDAVVGDLAPLTGGYSLITTKFDVTAGGTTTTYVLRTDQPADATLVGTNREAEWNVLDALTRSGAIPMPAAKWADITGEHLGRPSIISEFVDGPQLLGHLHATDPTEHPGLALQLAETIGVVHKLGGELIGETLSRPPTWDAYVDEYVAGWRGVEQGHVERDPFIRWVANWLDQHRPTPAPLTLVHGEFQTGNVMLDASGAMRVIDWEYAHIGDPRADLGWIQTCAAFAPPDPIALDPVGFCRRYCEVTGLTEDIINPVSIGWFAILAGYKSLGGVINGLGAMAKGDNHLLTSAYLVSAIPLSHKIWRENVAAMQAAMTQMMEQLS